MDGTWIEKPVAQGIQQQQVRQISPQTTDLYLDKLIFLYLSGFIEFNNHNLILPGSQQVERGLVQTGRC